MPTMLILGASSDIARATALALGMDGWDLHFAGRDLATIEKIAKDISIRTGREIPFSSFDALKLEEHQAFWQNLSSNIDGVFCAVGSLGEQEKMQNNMDLMQEVLCTNFTGLAPLLSMAANTFEERGNGIIIGISSVAGDRGRASNYVYGSAKAGFTAFLSGLRNRLNKKGVHVMTVKPGFVSTRMTENMELPEKLTATPEQIAKDILCGIKKKHNVIYSLWIWRWIMLIIKHLPEAIFKRLKL